MVSMAEATSVPPLEPVAVIGGGFTGATVARELASRGIKVALFDQGQRGPGGRASHRRVPLADPSRPIADDNPPAPDCFEFDHGCQFFRAETQRFRKVVDGWVENGWAAPWEAVFEDRGGEFFGFPRHGPFFVGVDGMQTLPRQILSSASASVTVHRGTRVASVTREEGAWLLRGTSGKAAFHDTAESEARQAVPQVLGKFAAVVQTDVSSGFLSWHRASAGLPEDFRIPERTRVALFAVCCAFEKRIEGPDGLSFGDDALWFAARTRSKPGYREVQDGPDCWTLLSTPAYAVHEITETPMQAADGAFRPQENSYLNTGKGPGPTLVERFQTLMGSDSKVLYIQGQRWGSAFPSPVARKGADTERVVCDVRYESATPLLRSEDGAAEAPGPHFVVDERGLYGCGDYCSRNTPGVEAAVLSAMDAAAHLADNLPRYLEGVGADAS
eukprot:TRINITY_DN56115_c0_g1_i1.p1 TRINITY_DN56115_c0_g1~~TRINITY_DN56115_c0_g1_i1.p1  ORF type:complete len:444 (-),score=76.48 TRINITY_DN56115_c0_g1_i1:200-1531(-)